ncbi:MAG: type 1 glutamine amidotransferase [Rhodothermales bacterium]|jgi:type 1 glutamine amidotransferase
MARPFNALLAAMLIALIASTGFAADKIKVLIVDGVNNHNWAATTKATKATLDQTGRFATSVSTSPSKKASKEEWAAWQPKFSDYAVVVSNFNDGGRTLWSEATRAAFEGFVSGGGGFVAVHAADNSSTDWKAYNEMIAVGGWGGRKAGLSGELLRMVDGKWAACCSKEGGSGGHGPQREFLVVHDKPEHPILAGLPKTWMHAKDELYHSLRGPARNVEVLAHAVSAKTKVEEPMVMLITHGKGKVLHLPLGHYNKVACECVGFQTVFARGTEFVATGAVTIGIPENFPGTEKPVVVQPAELIWPN